MTGMTAYPGTFILNMWEGDVNDYPIIKVRSRSDSIFKIKLKTKVNKENIESVSITLLAIAGILQVSKLFYTWDWQSDFFKYLVLLLSVLVIFLQFKERKITGHNLILMVFIACIIVYTCICTSNFSFLLICSFLLTGQSTSIENFVKRNLKILVIFGGIFYYGS